MMAALLTFRYIMAKREEKKRQKEDVNEKATTDTAEQIFVKQATHAMDRLKNINKKKEP